jgi:hypothetical protein
MQLTNEELIEQLKRAIVVINYKLVIAKYYGFTDQIAEYRKDALDYLSKIFILQNLNNCNIEKDLYCELSNIKKEYMNLCNESSSEQLQQEIESIIEQKLADFLPCANTVCEDVSTAKTDITNLSTRVTNLEEDTCCEDLEDRVDVLEEGLNTQGGRILDLEEAECCVSDVTINNMELNIDGNIITVSFDTAKVVNLDGTTTFSITPTQVP